MRNLSWLLAVSIFLPLTAGAQESVDTGIMRRIRPEALTRSQVASLAHQLTDVNGPRLTNSPGYRRAVAWTVQQMKAWGLTAAPESWGYFGPGWENEKTYAAMTRPYYQPLLTGALAWTEGTPGLVRAPVIVLDSLDSAYIDRHAAEIKGKIVLHRSKLPDLPTAFGPTAHRYTRDELDSLKDDGMYTADQVSGYLTGERRRNAAIKNLKAKGALALISRDRAARDGTIFVDGSSAFAKGSARPLPQLEMASESFLRLQRLLAGGSPAHMEIDIKNNWYTDSTEASNAIGEIPGTDPLLKDQVVMIGGHLDSWQTGTGATDNGAGCVVMMEAVRILQAIGVKPRRTIRIGLWGGEEQAFFGSYGYVKKHFGDAADAKWKPEQKKMSVYFNLDNGSGKIRGIYLQHDDSAAALFKSWLAPFAADGATAVTPASTGGTDHLCFDAVGIPAFQFVQDPLEYEERTHHSNMDVYDHLQLDDMKQAAMIVAAFVYNAAMRDKMIPRKPQPKPERFIGDFFEPF